MGNIKINSEKQKEREKKHNKTKTLRIEMANSSWARSNLIYYAVDLRIIEM